MKKVWICRKCDEVFESDMSTVFENCPYCCSVQGYLECETEEGEENG